MTPLNDLRCDLGEGAFWHPLRGAFFWVDITGCRLHSLAQSWKFDEMVSAMGWVDHDHLVIATETRLALFDLISGESRTLCALEAERADTRSNDGRADPQGGFWIGTMGKRAQKGVGAIWRWKDGELRRLFSDLSIPNAISFTPDGHTACFTDTPTRRVMRVGLDAEGWPKGAPQCWLDLSKDKLNPDGAVFDAMGQFWVAQWGAGRVAAYAPDGSFVQSIAFPALHTSCPAFGGTGLEQLFCTTAREGRAHLTDLDGAAFVTRAPVQGQAEHQIKIGNDASGT